jgi:murein DD-endopeptidase MepM/ murein hydrolase activator NlpD
MRVRCHKCRNEFEVPLHGGGSIEYDHCKNVFRVSYRFRTGCPACKTLLQLTPTGNGGAAGIPVPSDSGEKTEFAASASDSEATIPRSRAQIDPEGPVPTVRVSKPKTPRPEPFRSIPKDFKARRPVHVAVVKQRRRTLPIVKIVLLGVIAASTVLTLALTALAFRPPSPNTALREAPAPKTAKAAPKTPVRPEPMASEGPPQLYVPRLEKISSPFGLRVDPITRDRIQMHDGLDIAVPHRGEIVAALEGRVRFVGTRGGYGKLVIVEHDDGYETRYGHLDKLLVKRGAKVRQGDLLGLAGSTGRSTGPHLHFELRKDGEIVDPYRAELMSKVKIVRGPTETGSGELPAPRAGL